MADEPVAHWRAEHAYFKRLLELLHLEADRFPRGEKPNYELMLDIISYLRDYGDALHHPREDVAYERLDVQDSFFSRRFGLRGDLDPYGSAVDPTQTKEVVRHGAFRREPAEKARSGSGV